MNTPKFVSVNLLIFGFILLSGFLLDIFNVNEDELAAKGKYWKTECRLIETNIDNGFFSNKTNRLDCNGTINNVDVFDYNSAVSAYENLSQEK